MGGGGQAAWACVSCKLPAQGPAAMCTHAVGQPCPLRLSSGDAFSTLRWMLWRDVCAMRAPSTCGCLQEELKAALAEGQDVFGVWLEL